MYFEMSLQLYQYINALNEPCKAFAIVGIYFILHLLLLLLYWKYEAKKGEL